MKKVTNSYITVISHGKKGYWLHASKDVNEKHLNEANIKNYLPASELSAQHPRDGGCGQPQVNGSQHRQEAEHSLVNVVLSLDDKQVVKLPMSVIRYTAQKGKPIQMWMFFTPGIPSNRKEERWNWVPLERGIFLVISYNVFIANVCWSMSGGSSLLPWCLPVLERSNYLFVPIAKKNLISKRFFCCCFFTRLIEIFYLKKAYNWNLKKTELISLL